MTTSSRKEILQKYLDPLKRVPVRSASDIIPPALRGEAGWLEPSVCKKLAHAGVLLSQKMIADGNKFAFERYPFKWIESQDLESLSFEKATWIPLLIQKSDIIHGKFATAGYRKASRDLDSIIVPLSLREEFHQVDWQSVTRHGPDSAWADDEGFRPPGCYRGDVRVLYPVIKRMSEPGERRQWDLLQEVEVGLELVRKGDVWIRPEENDIEVAKLERAPEGEPEILLFRTEHLRDYLCAKNAALLITGFIFRDAVEEDFTGLKWEYEQRRFQPGEWEGKCTAIHEGGSPYGTEMAVMRVWRESVNPNDDVPEMPHPGTDPGTRSESFGARATGKKLFALSGRTWLKHWILPAQHSPRIRGDHVESRVHFHVENQERKALAGDALREYRGWLWFKPAAIGRILTGPKSSFKWYTQDTGDVGPAPNVTLHFGINKLGLINVLGYKMAELPEWVQKIWVGDNVTPEGGLSEELHMSQNLARPAETIAPEAILLHNLRFLQARTLTRYGKTLLFKIPSVDDLFRRVHRFYSRSFDDVCELCKELHRTIAEQIDIGLINATIDPANAEKANREKVRQIKRLAMWLDTLGLDGRDVTKPLAGVNDLRQGDAHTKGSDLRKSLALFGIAPDGVSYGMMSMEIIGQVANSIGTIANAIATGKITQNDSVGR